MGDHGAQGVLVPAVGTQQVVGHRVIVLHGVVVGQQLFHLGGEAPVTRGPGCGDTRLIGMLGGVLLTVLVTDTKGQRVGYRIGQRVLHGIQIAGALLISQVDTRNGGREAAHAGGGVGERVAAKGGLGGVARIERAEEIQRVGHVVVVRQPLGTDAHATKAVVGNGNVGDPRLVVAFVTFLEKGRVFRLQACGINREFHRAGNVEMLEVIIFGGDTQPGVRIPKPGVGIVFAGLRLVDRNGFCLDAQGAVGGNLQIRLGRQGGKASQQGCR